ncbi:MAG: mechanosensitive ion channel [Candidatus Glassbacteria bacterium]|nr:mechanosensitive ion channel [Candidatus Glassbacteria bacterium]
MDFKHWTDTLSQAFPEYFLRLQGFLPNLIKALVLLFIGWLIALFLRYLTARLIRRLHGLVQQHTDRHGHKSSGMEWLTSDMIARIVFWMVFLIFVAAATEALELKVVTSLLSSLVQYLPTVLAAGLIFFAGLILGNLARAGIQSATASAGIAHGEFMGQGARFAILLVTGVIVLDQIGVDSTLLIVITAIIVGAMIGGAALAFGLGARTAVSNIIASHYLLQTYRIGQRVKIGESLGKIVEFKTTGVVLDTPEGLMLVPSKEFSEKVSLLLDEGE